MAAIKKFLLIVLGLVVGTAGLALAAAGFTLMGTHYTVSRLIWDGEFPGTAVTGNPDLGTLRQEAAGLVGGMDLSRGISLSEDSLERLTAAWAAEAAGGEGGVPVTGPSGVRLVPGALDYTLNAGRLQGTLYGTLQLDRPLGELIPLGFLPGGLGVGEIRRLPTAVGVDAGLSSRGTVLEAKLRGFRVGEFTLPVSLIALAGRRLDRAAEDWNLPEGVDVQPAQGRASLSLEFLNGFLQGAARVREVRVMEEALQVGLVLDKGMTDQVMAGVKPLLLREGPRVIDALEEELSGEGREVLVEQAKAVLNSALAYGEPGGRGAAADGAGVTESGPSALVSYLEGEVLVLGREGRQEPAVLGEDLPEGVALKTGPRAAAELILAGGSIVRMGANSRFRLDTLPGAGGGNGRAAAGRLDFGGIRAKVQRLVTGEDRFDVKTPQAVMGVRGTDFTVDYDERKGLSVAVLEGAVEVDPERSDPIELMRNEKTDVSARTLEKEFQALEKERLTKEERRELEDSRAVRSRPEDASSLRAQRQMGEILEAVRVIVREVQEIDPREAEALEQRLEESGLLDFGDFPLENLDLDGIDLEGMDLQGMDLQGFLDAQ